MMNAGQGKGGSCFAGKAISKCGAGG